MRGTPDVLASANHPSPPPFLSFSFFYLRWARKGKRCTRTEVKKRLQNDKKTQRRHLLRKYIIGELTSDRNSPIDNRFFFQIESQPKRPGEFPPKILHENRCLKRKRALEGVPFKKKLPISLVPRVPIWKEEKAYEVEVRGRMGDFALFPSAKSPTPPLTSTPVPSQTNPLIATSPPLPPSPPKQSFSRLQERPLFHRSTCLASHFPIEPWQHVNSAFYNRITHASTEWASMSIRDSNKFSLAIT